MSDGQIKCKIISFRVSDEEFEAVLASSLRQGFPSVSLFARFTTLTFNASERIHSRFDADASQLWRRLDAVTAALERLTAQAGVVLAPFNMG